MEFLFHCLPYFTNAEGLWQNTGPWAGERRPGWGSVSPLLRPRWGESEPLHRPSPSTSSPPTRLSVQEGTLPAAALPRPPLWLLLGTFCKCHQFLSRGEVLAEEEAGEGVGRQNHLVQHLASCRLSWFGFCPGLSLGKLPIIQQDCELEPEVPPRRCVSAPETVGPLAETTFSRGARGPWALKVGPGTDMGAPGASSETPGRGEISFPRPQPRFHTGSGHAVSGSACAP